MAIQSEASRFFDGDLAPGSTVVIRLERVLKRDSEEWALDRRIGYRDRHTDADGNELLYRVPRSEMQNPPNPDDRFTSDLTSVPQLFTWLVPKSGTHLPAALLHDGLVPSKADIPEHDGPPVTRLEADRIFRDAMADLGTPRIRRWLIWSAVSIPTAWTVDKFRGALAYLGLAAIAVLGYIATLDLFDQIEVLWWMGNRPWNRELIYGALMAAAIPFVLAILWPKGLHKAGIITGLALALLIHVSIAVAGITAVYVAAEDGLSSWKPPRRTLKIALTAAAILLAIFTIWLCRRP